MTPRPRRSTLGAFARAGFQELATARDRVLELGERLGRSSDTILAAFARAADPDAALSRMLEMADRHPQVLAELEDESWHRLALLFGASPALGDFFCRHPGSLRGILETGGRLIEAPEARAQLLEAVNSSDSRDGSDCGAVALRVRYRELFAELMLYDLRKGADKQSVDALEYVARSLSDLADAALEAALVVARNTLVEGTSGIPIAPARLDSFSFAIITMGKCGARELNVVSDVDVMFVIESESDAVDLDETMRVATRLASEVMRAIHAPAFEPPLWEVDANLRPEGKQGALVRSLESMIKYYERWAKTWEFQALLKARAAAGDLQLGERFVARTRSMVWESSNREDFVGSVQRMRERVAEQIDTDDLDAQLKLGPGGLRDVEFSVQLLQLVHGQYDESLHEPATLPALGALVDGGYVAREDGERLARGYRTLRVLEHRLQLRDLRRTALMPRDDAGLRVLARASALAASGTELHDLWRRIRNEVRELHLKIFYAPLLNAVAALPETGVVLNTDAARARLHSIGFRDPDGAMRHLAALTKGNTRAARIQRNLLPVLLQWFADGRDPDYGLLAFRRVSEANRASPWYLRLLRDGNDAAERLARVLSGSRFVAEMLETIPEAVAWLEHDERLQPIPLNTLLDEMRALASRKENVQQAATALRAVHRREVLRLALGLLTRVINDREVAHGLDAAHTALLDGLLLSLRSSRPKGGAEVQLSLIGMGRYGGREMGFASDIDLLAVYRPTTLAAQDETAVGTHVSDVQAQAGREAERMLSDLRGLVADPRFEIELDFDLRPEGKNGPIVRSFEAYRAYYRRWSLTWEAQALLRARSIAGDEQLGTDFIAFADEIRYPQRFEEAEIREVRRIKARVESERLPRGVDPKRHLKLGPGGISDVEWLVQMLQLRHAHEHPLLRTTSTLEGLDAAVRLDLLDPSDRVLLESSWLLASRIRSAAKLWSGRVTDSLPLDRAELEGIAGVLGMPSGQTTRLEEQWFAASRRARAVFEREFFGYNEAEPGVSR